MALAHVIRKGSAIDGKFVGAPGAHSDPKDHLWLDGVDTKPIGY
jgi:hypothetical protein